MFVKYVRTIITLACTKYKPPNVYGWESRYVLTPHLPFCPSDCNFSKSNFPLNTFFLTSTPKKDQLISKRRKSQTCDSLSQVEEEEEHDEERNDVRMGISDYNLHSSNDRHSHDPSISSLPRFRRSTLFLRYNSHT